MKEKILVLVKAAPTWSRSLRQYQVCTAGVNEDGEWRRLYPFPETIMHGKDIRTWDFIEVETEDPTHDPRQESRKINFRTLKKAGRFEGREERREVLNELTENSLNYPLEEKRSLALVKPEIVSFSVIKNPKPDILQLTLDGEPFRYNIYGDVDLIYRWNCEEPCEFCSNQPHRMKCLDWGAHVLYKRYDDEEVAKEKVTDMCYHRMKDVYDSWFALGTHSMRPWRRWMIVGLLWMKKSDNI